MNLTTEQEAIIAIASGVEFESNYDPIQGVMTMTTKPCGIKIIDGCVHVFIPPDKPEPPTRNSFNA